MIKLITIPSSTALTHGTLHIARLTITDVLVLTVGDEFAAGSSRSNSVTGPSQSQQSVREPQEVISAGVQPDASEFQEPVAEQSMHVDRLVLFVRHRHKHVTGA